jgi:hypothetical protein
MIVLLRTDYIIIPTRHLRMEYGGVWYGTYLRYGVPLKVTRYSVDEVGKRYLRPSPARCLRAGESAPI